MVEAFLAGREHVAKGRGLRVVLAHQLDLHITRLHVGCRNVEWHRVAPVERVGETDMPADDEGPEAEAPVPAQDGGIEIRNHIRGLDDAKGR